MSGIVSKLGEGPLHRVRPDLVGTVCEGRDVTLVRWDVPGDRPVTPVHSHAENGPFTILLSGRVGRGFPHGAMRALDGADANLMDAFSPPRADYVAAARDRENPR